MALPIHIQAARASDTGLLNRLVRSAHQTVADQFHLTPENCPKHPSNCQPGWITADVDRGVKYDILFETDIPVGCVALEKADSNTCYLERLSVLPSHRHKGYGSRLVEHALKTAVHWQQKRISIGIIAHFEPLKNWYLRMGFIEQKTLDIDHLPFKVLLMEYDLNHFQPTPSENFLNDL